MAGVTKGSPDDAVARKADRISQKLAAKAAGLDRKTARLAEEAERLEQASDRLVAVDLWLRALGGGRKPRFTHQDVRAAAMRIVDAEGIDALSMRRLAAELQAPTMTLYHYVRTKDELLSLLADEVMAEVVLPDGEALPGEWKAAMSVLASRTRDVLTRHPWVMTISSDGPSLGPASVRHFDQSLQALAGLDQPLAVKLEILTTVDDYVFGYCLRCIEESVSADEGQLVTYVEQLLRADSYPSLEAAIEEATLSGMWVQMRDVLTDEDRFDRNLQRLLDGIERGLGPARRASPPTFRSG